MKKILGRFRDEHKGLRYHRLSIKPHQMMEMKFNTHKNLAEDYAHRIWDKKDLSAVDELLHEKVIIHSPLGDLHGRDAMKKVLQVWFQGFPDLVVENTWVRVEQDTVKIQWNACGTHLGEFKGVPPTGNHVRYSGVTIYRIQDNKIVEYWAQLDMGHILDQI